jgi:hypothetical protein
VRTATPGIRVITVFLVFATLAAWLAGTTLLWRGTFLDRAWELNPQAYARLAPLGRTGGTLFIILGGILAIAAVGWFKGRFWGWVLVVLLISGQVLGALVNIYFGEWLRGGAGLIVAGALLTYLLRAQVRDNFGTRRTVPSPS